MKDWKLYIRNIFMAVLAVIIIKTLFVTSCFIPSTGMENSLYKGEGILVGKWSYGYRIPFQSLLGYHRIMPKHIVRGDIVVFNNPMPSDLLQPVDSRDLYISRCIGVPGDTLMLDSQLMATDTQVYSPDSKNLYSYPSDAEDLLCSTLVSLGINDKLVGYTPDGEYIRSFSYYEYYLISQRLSGKIIFRKLYGESVCKSYPFVVPAKDKTVRIYPWNANLIKNMIVYHEGRNAELKGNIVYMDGNRIDKYKFTRDYYWMVSNDPVNTNDSRLFGFVPETHVIGKALRVWYPIGKGRFMELIK